MNSGAAMQRVPAGATSPLPEGARRSHALESLSGYLSAEPYLQVLDFGGINQANLDFVINLGHRFYAEDLIRAFDGFFTPDEVAARDYSASRIRDFLDSVASFPDAHANSVLLWDSLQFLPAELAEATIERLHRVVAPGGLMFAFFRPDPGGGAAIPFACRIHDRNHFITRQRGLARPLQPFNARAIERLFSRFASVKFFMTRDSVQEVVVRR